MWFALWRWRALVALVGGVGWAGWAGGSVVVLLAAGTRGGEAQPAAQPKGGVVAVWLEGAAGANCV